MSDSTLAHLDLTQVPFDAEQDPLPARAFFADLAITLAVLAGAIALAVLAPDGRDLDLLVAAIGVVVFAAASHVRMDIGAGSAVPTAIAFIPLCALVPGAYIPLAALTALALTCAVEVVRFGRHPQRFVRSGADAVFSIGPALILVLSGDPEFADLAVGTLLLMVVAPAATDFLFFHLRMRATGEIALIPPRTVARELAWVSLVDFAITPIGILVAFGAADRPVLLLGLLGLFVILDVFSRERRARLKQLMQLNNAYRGTAHVLGEVARAGDTHAGPPGCDVVELSLAVAQELELTERDHHLVEFGALLRDVGMVSVPHRVVMKPGALDDDEWAIVRRHTIEGQRMLDRVGGTMADVGVVVRATHERWDGTGYPDGLAGDAIPLAARIVACCDAFLAMTTERPYRAALSRASAVAELKRNHGTQFDPRVTEALLRIISVRPVVALATPDPVAA